MPRSSAQTSKTGDDTKSGQDLSVALVLFVGLISKCVHWVFDENLTLERMMIDYVFVLCLLYGTFKLLKERKQLMDEVTKLKEEIQIKSSEKQQVKAEEKAPGTTEPQPRKDLVRDQAVTNCVEVGQTVQVTKESEKPKQESK